MANDSFDDPITGKRYTYNSYSVIGQLTPMTTLVKVEQLCGFCEGSGTEEEVFITEGWVVTKPCEVCNGYGVLTGVPGGT